MRMKLFFFSLTFFALIAQLSAQPITFSRTYADSLNWSAISTNVIVINESYFIASRGKGLTSNSAYTMLTNMDQEGELLNRKFTHRNYERECWGAIGIETSHNDDIYTFVGERLLSSPEKININVTRYTTDFDTIWNLRNADSTFEDYPLNFLLLRNLIYVVGMRVVENSNPVRNNGIIFVADTSGNQVNFNQFDLENISHGFYSLVEGEGNNLFLAGGRNDSLYHGLVIKTDSLGNLIWHRWYPELWGANINSLSDSTYLLTSVSPNALNGMLTKINPDGDIIWQRTYPYGTELNLYTSIQTFDEGIVTVGLVNVSPANGNDAYIQKVDSEGNLLWQRSFNGIGSGVDFFSGVIETSDGGLLINGSTDDGFSSGGQNLWLLKLDANGCLDPQDCGVGVRDMPLPDAVTIYPNPAQDWLKIDIEQNGKPYTAQLLDATDRIIQSEQFSGIGVHTLNLSGLAQGIYYCRVMQGNEVVVEKVVVTSP